MNSDIDIKIAGDRPSLDIKRNRETAASKKSEPKSQGPKSSIFANDNKNVAECVVLKSAGYPFDFELMETTLEITDKSLFEQYARDQWLGMEVNSDSYLFDQKIIPDFAFKVVCVRPENSIISEQTKIKIIIEDKKNIIEK